MDDLSRGVLALEHRYEILEKQGVRGIATVYGARLAPFDAPVLVHVLDGLEALELPPPASRAVARRLRQSAQKAARVRSPHLLRVIDYGQLDSRRPFVITDAPDGINLRQILGAQGRLPLDGTLRVVGQVALALARLHENGVGHLGLHAGLVWVEDSPSENVVVGGLAGSLLRHEIKAAAPEALAARGVQVGHLAPDTFDEDEAVAWLASLGSIGANRAFDSTWGDDVVTPEEVEDSPSVVDPVTTDVFALAVLTYECLVGTHPFCDDATAGIPEKLLAVSDARVRPPSDLNVELDAPVWRVLRSGLARDPGARHRSALEFAEDLRKAASTASGHEILPTLPETPPRLDGEPASLGDDDWALFDENGALQPAGRSSDSLDAIELSQERHALMADTEQIARRHAGLKIRYLAAAALFLLVTNVVTIVIMGSEPAVDSVSIAAGEKAEWVGIDEQGRIKARSHGSVTIPRGDTLRYRLANPSCAEIEAQWELAPPGADRESDPASPPPKVSSHGRGTASAPTGGVARR